jgi:tetraacyldisaccharide 4'-kinase
MRLFENFIQSRYAIFLLPISWIWGLVSSARHFFYDRGFFKTHRVSIPVISVGNIAIGGRGKTPLVILLGKIFSSRRVAILSRGYGDGDEMKVIALHLPHAKLYVDADRVRSAKKAIAENAELIILDDGFQHRRLHRDFDLVIVTLKDLHGRFIPAGELRDSPQRLKKAIVIPKLQFDVSCPVSVKGERVAIFCGIANPLRFKKTVESLGGQVILELYLGDHEPIGEKRLQQFYDKAKLLNIKYLLCTEKDEVKLHANPFPIHSVRIETKVEGLETLIEKIRQSLDTRIP